MPRKLIFFIVLAVSLLSPLSSANVVHAQAPAGASCDSGVNIKSIEQFLDDIAPGGAVLVGINFLTSGLNEPPTGFGWSFGGVLEPLDQAADFVFEYWLNAVFFGIVGTVASIVSGVLVNFALNLNMGLTTGNDIISAGYGLILGFVNLGFVLAIIVMAFATMLRRSGWDAQSSLARLVIAALLINFSLLFAGFVLDIGTGLTKAFVSGAYSCPGSNLSNKFNVFEMESRIKKFLDNSVKNSTLDESAVNETGSLKDLGETLRSNSGQRSSMFGDLMTKLWYAVITSILSIFFATGLTIIGALTLFAIFLYLIVRYVVIMVLLIFMPVAWLGFIFPQLKFPGLGGNAWSVWWDYYLKWVFYGPIMAFFLYLTSRFIDQIGSLGGNGLIDGIGQMLVVVIFSLSSLYVANKLSMAGASQVYGMANKAWGKGLERFKGSAIGVATAPLRNKYVQATLGKMASRPSLLGMPLSTQGLGRMGLEASTAGLKGGDDFVKKYKSLPKERQNQVLDGLRADSGEFAAMLKNLTEKGDLENPEKYLGKRYERGLNYSMNPGVYKSLEKFSLATSASLEALAKGDIDGATKELTENIYSKAKGDDFKKSVKFSKVFKMDDASQGMHMKALLMSSPETVQGAFKSLSFQDQNKFNALKGKVAADPNNMSESVKEYLTTSAGQNLLKSHREPDKMAEAKEQARAEGVEEGKSEPK